MKNRAITYVEIIIVITLMLIAIGLYALYSQTTQIRTDINSQVNTFVSHLRLEQSDALSGKDNKSHGIHLESDAYTIFSGDTYSAIASDNFEIELPNTITIENISLNGSGSDIIFTAPLGETSTYGSLDFTSSQINKTITITIGTLGTIDY